MKKLLLASTAVAALVAGPAFAADLPRAAEPIAPAYIAPQAFNWTGFYAGLNAGYGFSGSYHQHAGLGIKDGDGFIGGAQVGYNYQYDPLVVGIEGEFDYADITDSAAGNKGQLKWRGSLTPRLGFAIDRFLPYVKGGLAFGDTKISVGGLGSDDNTQWGWTVGAGVEYALTNNLSVRAEYNYTDLGKKTYNIGGGAFKAGYSGSDVKAGINYRF